MTRYMCNLILMNLLFPFSRSRYIPEVCPFRSKFTYSSIMLVLAGEVLGHIAKAPFENLVS
jgi:hypothetical protein